MSPLSSLRNLLTIPGPKAMPLQRVPGESQYFDPEAVAVMLEAYDGAVTDLELRSLAGQERAARLILRFALGETDLNAARLRGKVVAMMRAESAVSISTVWNLTLYGAIAAP